MIVAWSAEGNDADGKQVAWNIDAFHIVGQIGLHSEYEEAGEFILHLNMAEDISTILFLLPITP